MPLVVVVLVLCCWSCVISDHVSRNDVTNDSIGSGNVLVVMLLVMLSAF